MDSYTHPILSAPSSSSYIQHYPSVNSNLKSSLSEDDAESSSFLDEDAPDVVRRVKGSSRMILGEERSHSSTSPMLARSRADVDNQEFNEKSPVVKSPVIASISLKDLSPRKESSMFQKWRTEGFFSFFRQEKAKKGSNDSITEASHLQVKQKHVLEQISVQEEKKEVKASPFSILDAMTACLLGVAESQACKGLQTTAFHRLVFHEVISSRCGKLAHIQVDMTGGAVLEFRSLNERIEQVGQPLQKEEMDSLPVLLKMGKAEKRPSLTGGAFANNYPLFSIGEKFFCDCFYSAVLANCQFSIVADGCGWGLNSQLAAQRAIAGASRFIHEMLSHPQLPVKTAENLAWVLLQSLAMAHEEIVCFDDDLNDIGTTTLNICFQFINLEGQKYLMVAGVGDCKCFVATEVEKNQYQVMDIACCNRLTSEATDPGGRLGPYVGPQCLDPDLRNLALTCIPLPKGRSIIFNMSDGVHDNLNPELLGKDPYEVEPAIPNITKWKELPAKTRADLTSRFQCQMLGDLINQAMAQEEITLDDLCQHITTYCKKITAFGRVFMEEHPTALEPKDKKLNPGKMDHCSIVAIQTDDESL